MKELINNFLTQFCIKTSTDEDPAITELYMDNHYHIEYENQGYYIPKDNSCYTDDDELLMDFLVYHFS
jgi:hypothetical protein